MAGESLSNFATAVLMAPFGVLLALAILRLDTRLAAPRTARSLRVRFCEVGSEGDSALSDPDGHRCPSQNPNHRNCVPKASATRPIATCHPGSPRA